MSTPGVAPHWDDKAGPQTLSDTGLWSMENAILLHISMGAGHRDEWIVRRVDGRVGRWVEKFQVVRVQDNGFESS